MATLEVGVDESLLVLAAKLGEFFRQLLGGSGNSPRLEDGVPLLVDHAKGAAVAEGFVEVELVDESEDLGLSPAEGVLGPFEAYFPS